MDATPSSYESSLGVHSSSLAVSQVTLDDLGLDEEKDGRDISPGIRLRTSDKANRTYESDVVRPSDDIKR